MWDITRYAHLFLKKKHVEVPNYCSSEIKRHIDCRRLYMQIVREWGAKHMVPRTRLIVSGWNPSMYSHVPAPSYTSISGTQPASSISPGKTNSAHCSNDHGSKNGAFREPRQVEKWQDSWNPSTRSPYELGEVGDLKSSFRLANLLPLFGLLGGPSKWASKWEYICHGVMGINMLHSNPSSKTCSE